jgi:hypothetical protein
MACITHPPLKPRGVLPCASDSSSSCAAMMARKKPSPTSSPCRKTPSASEHLGLTLREAKQLLNTIQKRPLQQQVEAFLDARSTCPDCGTPLKVKGYHRGGVMLIGRRCIWRVVAAVLGSVVAAGCTTFGPHASPWGASPRQSPVRPGRLRAPQAALAWAGCGQPCSAGRAHRRGRCGLPLPHASWSTSR